MKIALISAPDNNPVAGDSYAEEYQLNSSRVSRVCSVSSSISSSLPSAIHNIYSSNGFFRVLGVCDYLFGNFK